MAPQPAVYLLGLCNLVAGALVVFAPGALMPGVDGLGSPSTRLFGLSLGILLLAVGGGAAVMPPVARRAYLWLFGVGVKVMAAAVWGAMAIASGALTLAAAAAGDLVIAVAIAAMLRSRR
jgi:hypothetical protein